MRHNLPPSNAPAAPLAVTYREAGRRLSVCERTIATLVRNGRLRAVKAGRAVRIPVVELERFVAGEASE